MKLIVHAVEEDMAKPNGRDPALHAWVQTQIMHPTDPKRSTINHSIRDQAQILYDWSSKFEYNREPARAAELLEKMLLLCPGNINALKRLPTLLRELGLFGECLRVTAEILEAEPGDIEATVLQGEALVYLEEPARALKVFQALLQASPFHPLGHIGAAQAKGLLGGDPYAHLDAAAELDKATTLAVLRETFDYRTLSWPSFGTVYFAEQLPALLGLSQGEINALVAKHGLPVQHKGRRSIHESELSRWVGIQNRYSLLPTALHWTAPTPMKLPIIT